MISLLLKAAAGCKTGMCTGLTAAHPMKSSLSRYPPHTSTLTHTYRGTHPLSNPFRVQMAATVCETRDPVLSVG